MNITTTNISTGQVYIYCTVYCTVLTVRITIDKVNYSITLLGISTSKWWCNQKRFIHYPKDPRCLQQDPVSLCLGDVCWAQRVKFLGLCKYLHIIWTISSTVVAWHCVIELSSLRWVHFLPVRLNSTQHCCCCVCVKKLQWLPSSLSYCRKKAIKSTQSRVPEGCVTDKNER